MARLAWAVARFAGRFVVLVAAGVVAQLVVNVLAAIEERRQLEHVLEAISRSLGGIRR